MMKRRLPKSYTLSRVVIALVMGILIGYKTFWWSGVLVGVATLAFFLWAPRSGRYLMESGGGATPMRRDERMRAIRDRAARDAFVVLLLATSTLLFYYGLIVPGSIPVQVLISAWGLGGITYFVSDALQRQERGG